MPNIHTDRRGAILLITIDRAEAMNAFDAATSAELNAAIDMLDDDPELFLGVLTGTARAFSTGADLKAYARGEEAEAERGGFGMFKRPPAKPIIAAIEGFAVGGGLELALSCDLLVAARDAKLGLPEVRHGVLAKGGGLFRLPRRIPYHLAMELVLTGELRPAEFFHQAGLISRLCEPGEAVSTALDLAERILRNGPLALAASKQVVARAFDWTDEEAWTLQDPIVAPAIDSADAKEGVLAFAEKRRPVWTGR